MHWQARSSLVAFLSVLIVILSAITLHQIGFDERFTQDLGLALSLATGFGAVLATISLFKQLEESRLAREDSLRPVLVPVSVRVEMNEPFAEESGEEPTPDGMYLVTVRNIGVGPATNVRTRVVPTNARLELSREGWVNFPHEEEGEISRRADEVIPWWDEGGVGAGEEWELTVFDPHYRGDWRVLLRISYEDVFGNVFHAPKSGFASFFIDPSGKANGPLFGARRLN